MPVNGQGIWLPSLFPKQWEVMRACQRPNRENIILLSGPRRSSKTIVCLNAIAQHAWDTDRGNIVVIALTQSVGIDSGVWVDLTETVLPEWIKGNFGMEWIREPYVQNVTKKPACSVRNRYGNESRIQLDSLKDESEVEQRYKGKRYSMIFVNELSKWKSRSMFDALKQCLRMVHLREPDQLLLADTNPADEGTESWIYNLWYNFRIQEDVDKKQVPLQKALKLIEFTIDDNLAMTAEDKLALMADFAHDEDLLARYFYGKWVTASADAIFHSVFRPAYHIVGDYPNAAEPDPEMMYPEEDCFELLTGWDPGPTNCAACIVEKFFPKLEQYRNKPAFKLLDELTVIGEDVDLVAFVLKMLEKMAWWESVTGRKVRWRHISDRNVLDVRELSSNKYWAQIIYELSEGTINLEAVERGQGTVQAGIDLVRRLFWEDRIFINKANCPKSVEMFKSVKKGKTQNAPVQKGSPHKHPLDAFRYVLQTECYEEMNRQVLFNLRKRREVESPSTLVSVPL